MELSSSPAMGMPTALYASAHIRFCLILVSVALPSTTASTTCSCSITDVIVTVVANCTVHRMKKPPISRTANWV